MKMNTNELVRTLEILKREKPTRGFSLRRTLKRLKKYKEEKVIENYIKEIKDNRRNDKWLSVRKNLSNV